MSSPPPWQAGRTSPGSRSMSRTHTERRLARRAPPRKPDLLSLGNSGPGPDPHGRISHIRTTASPRCQTAPSTRRPGWSGYDSAPQPAVSWVAASPFRGRSNDRGARPHQGVWPPNRPRCSVLRGAQGRDLRLRRPERRHQSVDTLSRGLKQRLCLARALVHDPAVLLLDEPASGLDPRARVEMREILKELQRMGKTIVISSHILPELTELCTMIGIIDQGRMRATGPVQEVIRELTSGRRLRIMVMGRRDEALAILKALPSIRTVDMINGAIEAQYEG